MCKEASQSRIISLIELTIVEERLAEDCDVQNLINLTELEIYFFRFVTKHQISSHLNARYYARGVESSNMMKS